MNRDEFLKPRPLATKTVAIEGFGEVNIRQLSKSELCEYEKWLRPKGELNQDRQAKRSLMMVCMSVVDDDGKQILTIDDVDAIGALPGAAIDELHYEVMVINGYMKRIEDDELLGKSDS